MRISPDQAVIFTYGPFVLNATLVFTWIVMALLAIASHLITLRLSDSETMTRWQNLLEVIVASLRDQIRDVCHGDPGPYLPFIGTLFLYIATSNIMTIVPGFQPPTASLSTTTALAICVFFAVPIYAILENGVLAYFREYIRPTIFMLPFNIIGELSRTIALAIRLYGNIMSGTVIVAILLSIAPFFFPIFLELLGLLTGLVQAYIFSVLAMVYIASATRTRSGDSNAGEERQSKGT